ncbi:MAG: DNA repair protein RecO [Bacteroidales bacterium]
MIVLHTTKYKDSSLILHAYTQDSGRKGFLISGLGKKKEKISLFHPLSIIDYETNLKKYGNLSYLKEYSPSFPLNNIRSNIYKSSISIYLSELLYRCLREEYSDNNLYSFLIKSILELERISENYSNFHLWFTIRLTFILGFLSDSGPSGPFNNNNHKESIYTNSFSTKDIEIIENYNNENYLNCSILTFSATQRDAFLSNMIKYLEDQLAISINIKSIKILHQIFQ